MIRYTDHGDDATKPHQLSVQHPNSIAEVCLNDERRDCRHYGNVNGGKMGILEARRIAESGNKPKVEVGPSQGRLDGLQYKEEISCSRVCLDHGLSEKRRDSLRSFKDNLSFEKL